MEQKCTINQRLVADQKLTKDDLDRIEKLHGVREDLFDSLNSLDMSDESDRNFLRYSVSLLETLEYKLQDVWKFDRNKDMHSWWFKIPHCTCPKIDNLDNLGTPFRITTLTCPAHGKDNDNT